ncbi:hypothetical protein [Mycolicibacterium holsaticum]|uniref:DUF222 domain-containing protein n=1 Tax=Mycolicibacterium holsaticum TaxID=152142 RepID=A0A1E3RXR5_9MYCO|nr:hypothetical protein [Mycolicibacterium holsaticum]ODQ94638.1 hypothetical protein BHQ17_08370 [Mycolicibacterium holsaticum]
MRSNMVSAADVLTSIETAYRDLAALPLDRLSRTDLYALVDRLDKLEQQRVALNRKLIGRLVAEGGSAGRGVASPANDLARRLRISPGEAQRRICEAVTPR